MNHRDEFEADNLCICRDAAVFVTGLRGTTIAKQLCLYTHNTRSGCWPSKHHYIQGTSFSRL